MWSRKQRSWLQFHQLGVELFGSASALGDVEAVDMAWSFLQRLGVAHSVSVSVAARQGGGGWGR